ncbi:MAG: hypothetical protein KatS3mg076_0721 [Candidatus Binatia bacterium]|nr:MAG: hypothetical protein KatS3mg076_0721 [Candidatus Binatia bacterium]
MKQPEHMHRPGGRGPKPSGRSIFSLALAVVVWTFACHPACADSSDGWVLDGNLPRYRLETRQAEMQSEQPVTVLVGLKWRDGAALQRLLLELYSPSSPLYQKFLSPQEFDRRFAPAPEVVERLAEYLREQGLEILRVSDDRLMVFARGSPAAVRKAFGVRLARTDGGRYSALEDPSLPRAFAPHVTSVQGLENVLRLAPRRIVRPPTMMPRTGGAPFTPREIARVYAMDWLHWLGLVGTPGRSSTIGILTVGSFHPDDLTEFWQVFDVPRSPESVERVPLGETRDEANDETTLDVEWASSLAPGAPVVVYEARDDTVTAFLEMYHQAVVEGRASVLSTSWGICEDALPPRYLEQADAIFQKAAALGISVLAASGDSGAYCLPGEPSVDFPASHPLVTAVGGTSLFVDSDGSRARESAWEGSGSGQSRVWKRPLWQPEKASRRLVADVALNADPATGYYVRYRRQWWQYGGTSVGAPIWAALVAVANQYRELRGLGPLGLLQPRLCRAARAEPSPFFDVQEGGNQLFRAGPGWDSVTGWGTPNARRLVLLLGSPVLEELAGPTSRLLGTLPELDGKERSVLARLVSDCGDTSLSLRAPFRPDRRYELLSDGLPVEDILPQEDSTPEIRGLDPRGSFLVVREKGSDSPLWSGLFPEARATPSSFAEKLESLVRTGGRGVFQYRRGPFSLRATLRVRDLPERGYDVSIDGAVVAHVEVRRVRGGTAGVVRFDTRGARGALLAVDPLCKTLRVSHGPKTHLILRKVGASRGLCP